MSGTVRRPGRKNDCPAVGPSGERCRARDNGHPGRHYTYLRDEPDALVIEEWSSAPRCEVCGTEQVLAKRVCL